jgi:hypothetical protein
MEREGRAGLICVVLLLGAGACRTASENGEALPERWITGTVKYVDLEGGFYGIVDDQGKRYDPVNLPEAFKEDGLRVKCHIKKLPERMSFHMWGTLVGLTEIERL